MNPELNVTRYTYDGLNRLIQTSRDMNTNASFADAADIITSQAWDDSSRVTARTDDNGNTTRYAYDALNRLIVTQLADGTTHQIGTGAVWNLPNSAPDLSAFISGCDVHDNRARTIDANLTRIDTTYNLLDRIITNQVTRGTNVVGTTNEFYQYDGALLRAQWVARRPFTIRCKSCFRSGSLRANTGSAYAFSDGVTNHLLSRNS